MHAKIDSCVSIRIVIYRMAERLISAVHNNHLMYWLPDNASEFLNLIVKAGIPITFKNQS
jgi:hypothetical protein